MTTNCKPEPFCRKVFWERYRRISRIPLDLDVYPHLLAFGVTGSGKTTGIKSITAHVLISEPDCQIIVCDFKGQDYAFLEGCCHYYSHFTYGAGIEQFQKLLEMRISGKGQSTHRILLLADEWNNFLSALESKKERDRYISLLSYCLNMGRSYHMNVICGTQSAHVDWFGRARDSFNVLGLGMLSKESISMLFPQYSNEIKPQPRGCGYLLLDGRPLEEIIIPQVREPARMERLLAERANG